MTWLLKLLEKMTPEIAEAFHTGLTKLLQALYEKALETENGWDDWGVKLIANTFSVELEKPVTTEPE